MRLLVKKKEDEEDEDKNTRTKTKLKKYARTLFFYYSNLNYMPIILILSFIFPLLSPAISHP